MTEASKQVTFKIQRFDPEKDSAPHFQEFNIPTSRSMTILDGLIFIKENIDSTIAFRTSCRMAICGSCGMFINKYPHLACHTQIEEFHANTITLKPLPNMPIIKDLVADMSLFFNIHKSIKPYIIRQDAKEMASPTAEFDQRAPELAAYLQFTYCIKCGLCFAACPTSGSDKCFLGPQALAQCYHYCADNRDAGETERFAVVDKDHGAWYCHLAGACSEVCPKGVDPALAIQLLKRRLVAQALGLKKKAAPSPVVPPSTETKPKIAFPAFTAKKTK